MEKILGYNVAEWGLFLKTASISKYLIEVAKSSEKETFIHPLAEELEVVITDILQNRRTIPGYELSSTSKNKIVAFIKNTIDPVIDTRKINAAIMLLVMIKTLYDNDFKPIKEVLGVTIVNEFLEEFTERMFNNTELESIYSICFSTINVILYPDKKKLVGTIKLKEYKEEFKTILDESYQNSLSHGLDHVEAVCNKALYLNDKYNLNCDKEEIVIASLFHDMFAHKDRKNHHILAHDWIMSSIHPLIYSRSMESKRRIAMAIKEHRSNHRGDFYSDISELIATADREAPVIEEIIKRSYQYQLDNYPKKSHREMVDDVEMHLNEKYSRHGYVTYTKMYAMEYNEKFEVMYNIIDKIVTGSLKINIAKQKVNIKVSIKRKG